MLRVSREQLERDTQWNQASEGTKYAIYGPTGRVYDMYQDRATALRVLHDVAKRYGDGYTLVTVDEASDADGK